MSYDMTEKYRIKFIISPYRKYKRSNFNGKLSDYWRDKYYGIFRGW